MLDTIGRTWLARAVLILVFALGWSMATAAALDGIPLRVIAHIEGVEIPTSVKVELSGSFD